MGTMKFEVLAILAIIAGVYYIYRDPTLIGVAMAVAGIAVALWLWQVVRFILERRNLKH